MLHSPDDAELLGSILEQVRLTTLSTSGSPPS